MNAPRSRTGAWLAALALCACGDDGAGAGSTADGEVAADSSAADTTPAPDTTEPSGDTSAGDVDSAPETEPSACDGVVCQEPPPPACSPDRLAAWSYGADASCEVDAEGQGVCRYPVSDTRCADGEACRVEGDAPICAAPRTTCEVALSRAATWVSAVRLPSGEDDACCFDFDGDDQPDNGLAELVQRIAPVFDADVQAFIDAFLQRGLNAYLLQFRRLDDYTEDVDVGIDVLLGLDPDGVYDNNLLGTERFWVHAGSYDGPSPRSSVTSATVAAGTLRGRAPAMALLLPLTTDPFDLRVTDLRLDGRVALGDNGRGPSLGALAADVHGARLGALVPVTELYRAVNAFAAETCACLETAGQPLLVEGAGGWECRQAGTSACDQGDPDESICIDLATYCSAALFLIAPDVADSISIGLWIQGVSATLQGFVGPGGEPLECP